MNAFGKQAIAEATVRVRKSVEQMALDSVALYLGIKLKQRGDTYALTFASGEERELSDIELDALSDAFSSLSRASHLNADFNEPNPDADAWRR